MDSLVERCRERAASYGVLRKSAMTAIVLDQSADELTRLTAENARLRIIVGLHVNADAYRDTFPEDEADAKQLAKSETWHRLSARSQLTPALEADCHEAAKAWLREQPETKAAIASATAALTAMGDV